MPQADDSAVVEATLARAARGFALMLAAAPDREYRRATLVVDDDGGIGEHLAPASHDAILLTDTTQRSSAGELSGTFAACRQALLPGGVIVFRTRGTVDIDMLRALLAESFEWVDVFTWNGTERRAECRTAAELFAVGRTGGPYPTASIPLSQTRAVGAGGGWTTVANRASLPGRFILRATVHARIVPPDAAIHFVFATADRQRFFWTGLPVRGLTGHPVDVMLASDLLACVGGARWEDVERVVMRVRSPSGAAFDVRISDVRVMSGSTDRPAPSAISQRAPRPELARTTLTSKLYDPTDYHASAFAQIRSYFDSWWYVLATEKVKFSYSSRNRAWEYAQLITSVPFQDTRVLDLGTSGSLAPIYLARMMGCFVVTFDLHWEAERRLLYEAAGVSDRVRVDVGNMLEPLAYEDNSFDIVTCWSVIEHLRDYSLAVREMKRVCKPGGYICLTTDFGLDATLSPKSGVTFNREGLDRLIAEFDLGFVGKADYDTVELSNPANLAADGEYTFASIVLQN